MKRLTRTTLAVLLSCTLGGVASAADKGAKTPDPSAATAAPNGGKGKVLETMDAGGYTYLKVEIGGKPTWAAAPAFKVKKGDLVTVPPGAPMANFHSETLKRDFPLVYFVGGVDVEGGKKGAQAAKAALGEDHSKPKIERVKVSGVKKAEGGATVGEVFARKKELSGKEVTLRGKVVKFTGGIMNKNWLHVQDGSGGANTNDLTVTTNGTVAVGDTVVVKGKLATDKDFGYGYRYDVILEDAKVAKE
ncbi:MAG: DNA-binding protein [Deltaproteobacteria bacterium]|nr:DNA-binding protein [Deltaproteobacteria bacterium]